VLSRKEFGFSEEIINDMIGYFKRDGEFINAEYLNVNFSDETDKKFYEVYKSGEARYLITGNIKHFPKDDSIVISKNFIQVYEK
jgi:predicted nucleic acid-binding protein